MASKRAVFKFVVKNFKGGGSCLLFKPIKFSAIIDNIKLLCKTKIQEIIHLNNNIKMDLRSEKIYQNDRELFLSNLEHKLMLLLGQNANSIVSFSMIDGAVYNNESLSKISMQNMLGRLRKKLNLNIKSIHNKGYVLKI